MAYKKEQVVSQILKAIEKHKITFFDEICLYVEPALSTLYSWKLEEIEDIKAALAKNKISRKSKMRNKWEQSENATLQIAAYKLIADDEEIAKLNTSKVQAEHSGKNGDPIQTENKHIVEFRNMNSGNTPNL